MLHKEGFLWEEKAHFDKIYSEWPNVNSSFDNQLNNNSSLDTINVLDPLSKKNYSLEEAYFPKKNIFLITIMMEKNKLKENYEKNRKFDLCASYFIYIIE